MASILGWQQKWGAGALTNLEWDFSWNEGFPVGNVSVGPVGHMSLSQTGFGYLIDFQLGDLTLDLAGRSTLDGNVTNIFPGEHTLGNLSLQMVGRMTTVGGPFDTVDPFWLDAPNTLGMNAHMGFPGVITIAEVLSHPLGAVSLTMVAHMVLPNPQPMGNTIRKDLGALSLTMLGGIDMTADIISRTGAAHPLGDVTLPIFGRSTVSSTGLNPALPPHPLGDVSLALSGSMTTSVITLFSGGPISIGSLTLAMRGNLAPRFNLSYPPFDVGSEVSAILDPSVTPIIAKVEPDSLASQ